jgi:hypothetical protein
MKRTQRASVAEVEMTVPLSLRKDRYQAGFAHAMRGGQLDKIEYFRLSFREGFRAAKLQMRDMRRKRNIIDFPLQGKMKVKSL